MVLLEKWKDRPITNYNPGSKWDAFSIIFNLRILPFPASNTLKEASKELRHLGFFSVLLYVQHCFCMICVDYTFPIFFVAVSESDNSTTRIVCLPSFMAVSVSISVVIAMAITKRIETYTIFGTFIYMVSAGLFYR